MKTILIIEDNNDIRDNVAEFLELEGYRVFATGNGRDGLKMAIDMKPDVIICDIVMPEMDGYAVHKALRKNEITKDIKFIFSTAQSQTNEIKKAYEAGVTNYLLKPFDEKRLIAYIESGDEPASDY